MSAARYFVTDGVQIPESLIAQESQNHPGGSPEEVRAAAAHALAVRALLLDRAAELGLTAEPELDDRGREETPEEALVRAVLAEEVDPEVPSETECRRVYDATPGRFRTPVLYEASHILFAIEGDGETAVEAARLAAETVGQMLQETPARFAGLALAYSACPSSGVGGSLGQLGPGDLAPEVERAFTVLLPGQISSAPVRSRFGWHILRLDRRIDSRQLPFEQVAGRIRMHLESRAWIAGAVQYVSDLAARARSRGVGLVISADGDLSEGATLGDMIADTAAAPRLLSWLAATDADLLARVEAAAGADSAAPADWVRAAVANFVQGGDDEAWTRVISAAQGAEDPALSALGAILKSRLVPAKATFTLIRRR
ncbi:MAG: peptidyl-prolyl cis-trans isomerase [Caulobacter sp.]|nr:peptidyl-prolyl cis-trans isomerase [Caulobacter sp.]